MFSKVPNFFLFPFQDQGCNIFLQNSLIVSISHTSKPFPVDPCLSPSAATAEQTFRPHSFKQHQPIILQTTPTNNAIINGYTLVQIPQSFECDYIPIPSGTPVQRSVT